MELALVITVALLLGAAAIQVSRARQLDRVIVTIPAKYAEQPYGMQGWLP
jgi:hypothetical protein